jgi:hypothetical protein
MLPESFKNKKKENVCVIFWLPCLPYKKSAKRRKKLLIKKVAKF